MSFCAALLDPPTAARPPEQGNAATGDVHPRLNNKLVECRLVDIDAGKLKPPCVEEARYHLFEGRVHTSVLRLDLVAEVCWDKDGLSECV